ncbi:hypothetical protein HBA55_31460 [Pseudomaricurvus alkylphenolicus]|uniref:hypothetical protein n=1 Tax=Pseudomaricurvus alkylphenolicus TaxID=1306991 RepID=UPI0014220A04|nr:hypothetical protein [Pseudomaricurvus alkylphenolicus]NIB44159.1 hypothetical protein [Pseudomaricurvus alkylphenolicus]
MNKITTLAIVAASLASGFGLAVLSPFSAWQSQPDGLFSQESPTTDSSPITAAPAVGINTISLQDAEHERESQFRGVSSVADILTLPHDFMQTEALYVMAGRADVDQLHQYIDQAEALLYPDERKTALQILYSRYSEIDPRAALNHLHAKQLDIADNLIYGIFNSWAKVDLNAAIASANNLRIARQQKLASDAILAAYGNRQPQLLQDIANRLLRHSNIGRFSSISLLANASTNPEDSIRQALAIADVNVRRDSLFRIGRELAKHNPRQALDYMQAIPELPLRRQLQQQLLNQWASESPREALDYALRETHANVRQNNIRAVLQVIAGSQPELALQHLNALEGRTRQRAATTIFSQWASQDIHSAVAAAAALEDPQTKQRVISALSHQYARQHPHEAMAWADQLPDHMKASSIQNVISSVAQQDPDKAIELALGNTSGMKQTRALQSIIGQMANSNARRATQYLSYLPEGSVKDNTVRNLAANWARANPREAVDWIRELEGRQYSGAMQSIAQTVVRQDPEFAEQLLVELPNHERQQWVTELSSIKATTDIDGAFSWLSQFAQEPYYSQAIDRILQVSAATDTARSVQIFETLENQAEHTNAALTIVSRWAQQDPASAVSWATTLSDPNSRQQAMDAGLGQWLRYDRHSAVEWAVNLEESESRDQTLTSMVRQTTYTDLDLAPLINSISSDEYRNEATKIRFRNLWRQDAEAAERFLDQVYVSDALKESLLSIRH